jgi:putative transposase
VFRKQTYFVAVDPRGTTKECASCGTETDKPLWVREHSCPSCGFEADRDANAALKILSRGFEQIGTGCPESTPVETALPADTGSVFAKRVVETGSPTLKERAASAVSELGGEQVTRDSAVPTVFASSSIPAAISERVNALSRWV